MMSKTVERMQDKLYHDLILPEETINIRAKAREFADRVIAPKAYEIATIDESKHSFSWDILFLWQRKNSS